MVVKNMSIKMSIICCAPNENALVVSRNDHDIQSTFLEVFISSGCHSFSSFRYLDIKGADVEYYVQIETIRIELYVREHNQLFPAYFKAGNVLFDTGFI